MNIDDYTAIILARGGSKRVMGKNIKIICGVPLIYWVLDAAVNVFETVIVATDSAQIKSAIGYYGSDSIKIYDRETVPDTETSTESIMKLSNMGIDKFILMQCTSPLVTGNDIKGCINLYEEGIYDSVVSGTKHYRRKWYNHFCEKKEQPLSIINGAVMISSIQTIKRYGYIAGGKCGFYEMPSENYFEVDTEEDFYICEALLKRRQTFS